MNNPGENSVVIVDEGTGKQKKVAGRKSVRYTDGLIRELRDYLGEENVAIR